ncbi:MAG TPA: ASKHA domain-containing protein, partial [Thauera phenylacetica]|nr:ASKHA domain-containing protein [Thauera phenylacetica]
LAEAGLAADSIERFVLAGAFGAYIDIASGIEIGLFPPLPRERFVQVGNAAGEGVRRLLLSCVERARARELARASRACALNARADFQKVFLGHIGFAPASDSASPPVCALSPRTVTEESPS